MGMSGNLPRSWIPLYAVPANRFNPAMVWRFIPVLVLAAALSGALPRPSAAELVDLELVMAVDVSGSIDLDEAELQRAGYVSALTDPQVVRTIQAGKIGRIAASYVEWAGDHYQATIVDWTVIDGPDSAAAFAKKLANAPIQTQMWTSLSGAIDYGIKKMAESPYQSRRRVVDISGDGPNNDGRSVTLLRDRAVQAGIVINGLPIVNDRASPWGMPPMPNLDLYYEDCVIGGPGAFIIVANSFQDFARAIRRKLILEIAGLAPEPVIDRDAAPGITLAAEHKRPRCDEGEKRTRGLRRDEL
jgi:hypothetical protein